MLQVALIAALDARMAIGREGKMPWPKPGDLKRFKQLTLGKPVVMGRKTFQAIGKPLPGRTNIVLTRDESYQADGCIVANSIRETAELADDMLGVKQVMVAGGGEIYEQFLPRADRMYLTVIYHDFEGDTFFPEFSPGEWLIDSRQDFAPNDLIGWPHAFFSLRRNRPKPMSALQRHSESTLPDLLLPIEDDEIDLPY